METLLVFLGLFYCCFFVKAQWYETNHESVKFQSEMELFQWDLQDECSQVSQAVEDFYRNHKNGLADKIAMENSHANFLRTFSNKLKKYSSDDVPYELFRNWTLFTKCGDFLLSKEEFKARDVFTNMNLKSIYLETSDCQGIKSSLQDISNQLAANRNITYSEELWNCGHYKTQNFVKWYSAALNFTNKAATLNDCEDAKQYWETITEVPEGYQIAEDLWSEIEPLYRKLHKFVTIRINKYYNTSYENILTPFALGSLMGDDWTNIADLILPNPQLYYDLKVELEAKSVQDFYKHSERMARKLKLPGFGKEFYENSNFNINFCQAKVLNFCAEEQSRVLACNKTTLSNYFATQETGFEIITNKIHMDSLVRLSLRESPILEAVNSMAALLVWNQFPKWNILSASAYENEDTKLTALLLIALRVLPKIAYYHTVDQFRLQELLEPNTISSAIWKTQRENLQGISTAFKDQSDFLIDENVLNNKPYLAKYLGLFIQFQLLQTRQVDIFSETDAIASFLGDDTTFQDFLQTVPEKEPLDSLSYYFNLYEISADALLEFFEPLEDYLENAPLEQSAFTIKLPKTTEKPTVKVTLKPKNSERKAQQKAILNETELQLRQNPMDFNVNTVSNKEKNAEMEDEWNLAHIGFYLAAGIVLLALVIILSGLAIRNRRSNNHFRRNSAA